MVWPCSWTPRVGTFSAAAGPAACALVLGITWCVWVLSFANPLARRGPHRDRCVCPTTWWGLPFTHQAHHSTSTCLFILRSESAISSSVVCLLAILLKKSFLNPKDKDMTLSAKVLCILLFGSWNCLLSKDNPLGLPWWFSG